MSEIINKRKNIYLQFKVEHENISMSAPIFFFFKKEAQK